VILDEARMHKHTYEAYKDMIKVEIKLLQLYLEITRKRSRRCFKRYNIYESIQLDVIRAFTSPERGKPSSATPHL
jgi:hypothetical protein